MTAEQAQTHRKDRLEALYRKFGRDRSLNPSLPDVSLLLTSKLLLRRDAPKGNIPAEPRAVKRSQGREIAAILGYVKSLLAGLARWFDPFPQRRPPTDEPKDKTGENEPSQSLAPRAPTDGPGRRRG